MNREVDEVGRAGNVDDDVDVADDFEDTVVIDEIEDVDNVGDLSVEINVEELVAKLEAADDDDVVRKRAIRRRLEELREQKSPELDSTYNFNLDDDV